MEATSHEVRRGVGCGGRRSLTIHFSLFKKSIALTVSSHHLATVVEKPPSKPERKKE